MRLPRLRFNVRWLMIVVAVVAVAIAGERMWRLRSTYLTRSAEAGQRERNFASISLDIAGDPSMAGSETVFALMPDGQGIVEFRRVRGVRRVFYPRRTAEPANPEAVEKLARWCRETANQYGELRRKYERAARYPWLSVEPDPPRPR